MKTELLYQDPANRRLILIFAGWGTDAAAYRHVRRTGWDIALCHDYSDLQAVEPLPDRYETIYLYAWSLGVAVAEALAGRIVNSGKVRRAYAVNGTPRPCDDIYGIPESIYNATMSTLSERNLYKFRLRMFGGKAEMEKNLGLLPVSDDIESLRISLVSVAEAASATPEHDFPWTAAYISEEDRIFPPDAMHSWWEGKTRTISLPLPHFVDMERIVDYTVPDTKVIGEQFYKSRLTYDDHATAQKIVAEHLVKALGRHSLPVSPSVLEIGQGTGHFTSCYAPVIKPSHAVYVDLAKPSPLNLAQEEEYIEADAEQWIGDSDGVWDMIVSSSAVQWFADLRRFLYQCARHLSPGGVIALSGYAAGNLSEFDSLRPNPMNYPSADDVRGMAEEFFGETEVWGEEIRILFDNPREALLHLRATGVSSTHQSEPGSFTMRQVCGLVPKDADGKYYLTYRPFYLIARKN